MSYQINNNRLLNTFECLIRINSHSGKEDNLIKRIKELLSNINIKFIPNSSKNKNNLLFMLPGNNSRNSNSILFSAHMDTVESTENIKIIKDNGIIKTDGSTILGADDKSGIAAILECLYVLSENNLPHPDIEVCLTVEEEIGLRGANDLNLELLKSRIGFILDSNGDIGKVITQAPTQISFESYVYGKSAHAGVEPENGKNAIIQASNIITSIPIGRIDETTTSNIGIINGGKATNIVPDKVYIKGEIRSLCDDKLNEVNDLYKKIFETHSTYGFKVTYEPKKMYSSFNINKDTQIISSLIKTANNINLSVDLIKSGGGSDANVFNQINGMNSVVLSTGMENVHTNQEYIKVDNLTKLSEWLVEIACEYSNNNL